MISYCTYHAVCCEASSHAVSSQSSALTSLPMSDLLAAESLMDEEETTSRCCDGRLTTDDSDPFASLLHLTDHCLYRIVRWARNRPDFANISVILLPFFVTVMSVARRPTQPPTLSRTGNEYRPKCSEAVWLGNRGRHGSFYVRMHDCVAGKHTLTCARDGHETSVAETETLAI